MANMINKRLLSLDVLRGITIAGMITVNNPGSWGKIYAPLRHAEWNGLTPTDLVFPFFMFIMGVSIYISYSKFDFKFEGKTFLKLVRRSLLLFFIGLALNWFGLTCRGMSALRESDMSWFARFADAAFMHFENLRILGVLQRLAIVSFCGSLILLTVKQRFIPWLIGILLVGYSVLMIATDSLSLSADNIVARLDLAVLGESHMYHIQGVALDPEGLLSTISCVAHVLLGVMAGGLIMKTKDNVQRVERLSIFGTIIMMIGFLWDYAMPINKALWSSSYTLVTCGLASLLLALLLWVIDVKGYRRWTLFFESFGVNPMAIFVMAGVISNLISNIGFTLSDGTYTSIKGYLYNQVNVPLFGEYLGSLIFALSFIAVCWSIAHILYRKKIYIKI